MQLKIEPHGFGAMTAPGVRLKTAVGPERTWRIVLIFLTIQPPVADKRNFPISREVKQ
jgi:hypothetical protein